jgi:hypothetical protein
MVSKKKAGTKAAGTKKASLRDLPRKGQGQEGLTDEHARKVKGGVTFNFTTVKVD